MISLRVMRSILKLAQKPRPVGAVCGLFVLLYGVFRFVIEFVRQPDAHLNFIAFDWLTMGQILSSPMILLGFVLIIMANRQPNSTPIKGE